MEDLIRQFVLLWAVIDPIGTLPVFLAVTASGSAAHNRKIALVAVGVASLVLLFFIVAGEILLESMSIPLSAFQVAGGVVLFVFALSMIFGESKPEEELHMVDKGVDSAIFPLAIPSIASPGAMMAVVLLTDNHRFSIVDQVITTGIVLLIMLITLLLLLVAPFIQKIIGTSGASVISRVMGLILAAVATNSVLEGVQVYFQL
ncbi:MarC family protein [Spartinivicinus ruber]|uniref:MarC family protein n=1 Tax=Spartinivicinus ruber TaxID=2683272 RepID=UPI0013D0615D|nr:MarC family protein [Spartinivicinus ruber]